MIVVQLLVMITLLQERYYAPDLRRESAYEMMGGVCLSVSLSVAYRTERPRKSKIGRMEAHLHG